MFTASYITTWALTGAILWTDEWTGSSTIFMNQYTIPLSEQCTASSNRWTTLSATLKHHNINTKTRISSSLRRRELMPSIFIMHIMTRTSFNLYASTRRILKKKIISLWRHIVLRHDTREHSFVCLVHDNVINGDADDDDGIKQWVHHAKLSQK